MTVIGCRVAWYSSSRGSSDRSASGFTVQPRGDSPGVHGLHRSSGRLESILPGCPSNTAGTTNAQSSEGLSASN